ncbi:MAG: hypothetical protein ACJ76V_08580 [Thermoleophilaceae bacterium]
MTAAYEHPEHDPDEVPTEEQLDIEGPNEGATDNQPEDDDVE